MTRRRRTEAWAVGVLALVVTSCSPAKRPSQPAPKFLRPTADATDAPRTLELSSEQAGALLCQILAERDDDCDRRITVDDARVDASPGARWPYVARIPGVAVEVQALHQAAQLVQELVLGLRGQSAGRVRLDLDRAQADPASYLGYRITEHYWDRLTRRIDADPERLLRAAADEKLGAEGGEGPELCSAHVRSCAVRRPQTVPATPAQPAPPSRELHVYFPEGDAHARSVFLNASLPGRVAVHALPEQPTPAWFLETTRARRHGLLTLALTPDGAGRPFVVPGGRFNEMYGWDSFFIAWGLVQDPRRVELARALVDNQAYEITHYGKILNANRTYYLTRSQPPFLTSSISEVWKRLPRTADNRRWLEAALAAAIREYRTVWSKAPRRLELCAGDVCLVRYFSEGRGEPPEVEPGHFDWFYQAHAVSHGHCRRPKEADPKGAAEFLGCVERVAQAYRDGTLRDRAIDDFFKNDGCVRESGHDTSFRWFVDAEERCTDFVTVDLNALLFKAELDIADLLAAALDGRLGQDSAEAFCERAKARAGLMQRYLWDDERGLFFDYDTQRKRRSRYLAATTLYPLWASTPGNICGASLVTPAMAAALRSAALGELEAPGGLLSTSPQSVAQVHAPVTLQRTGAASDALSGFEASQNRRQWEAPNGWAPHQMLAWVGLDQAGFADDAQRLAYRWLYTIVKNAASFHGTVPEKFDVVARSHAVFAEYGNVNTEFSYIADEGFGWMNASFVVGWQRLSPELKEHLKRLTPPEELFRGGEAARSVPAPIVGRQSGAGAF